MLNEFFRILWRAIVLIVLFAGLGILLLFLIGLGIDIHVISIPSHCHTVNC